MLSALVVIIDHKPLHYTMVLAAFSALVLLTSLYGTVYVIYTG